MRKYVLVGAAALSLFGAGAWGNVQRVVTPSQTGPNFNAAMDEAGSSVQTRGRTAHGVGTRKSAVLERSAELGGL